MDFNVFGVLLQRSACSSQSFISLETVPSLAAQTRVQQLKLSIINNAAIHDNQFSVGQVEMSSVLWSCL